MIHSLLIGMVAGMRSMTPLAAVTGAAWRGTLPGGHGAPALAGHPLAAAAGLALAAGESIGDKWRGAPDRITAPGLAARVFTGAVAGAALAPKAERTGAALAGALGAVVGGYLSWAARVTAIERWGQARTGFVEDAIAAAAAAALVRGARPG